MGLANFAPTIWSARLLRALERQLVFAQAGIVNRDYEGEIRAHGDTVKINSVGDPTISDYTRNTDMSSPEELNSAQSFLLIDQQKSFNFAIDDVDAAQSNVSVMDEAMRRAAYGLRVKVDTKVSTDMLAAVPSGSTIGSTGTPETLSSSAEAYEYLVNLSVELDEADIPEFGRWVIVPPWFHGHLLKDDRFVKAGTPKTDAVLANGFVGEAAGFMILKSNTVPSSGTRYSILAGTSEAYSYAEQIIKVEAYRPEKRFSDAVKGLHVYGGKVIRPEYLACLHITKS